MENYPEKYPEFESESYVEPERPGFEFRYLYEILIRPSQTFEKIIPAGHAWVWPFLLYSIILILSSIVILSSYSDDPSQLPENFRSLNLDSETLKLAVIIFTTIFTPVVAIITFLVSAGIYMFFESLIMGGKAKFREVMNVVSFSYMVMVPRLIIQTLFVLVGGKAFDISFSLNVLLSSDLQGTFIYNWLSNFELFQIWVIIVIITGLSVLYKHSKAKTAVWLIPLTLMWWTLHALVSSISMESLAQ
jgi:hypothetical protein